MSISLFSAATSGLQYLDKAEKDAQQTAAQANAEGEFASLLARQAGAATDVATISGRPGNGVISAVLINAGVGDAALGPSISDMQSGKLDKPLDMPLDARDAFLDFAQKTPAEQMRAMVLADMGLTEEQLAALDAKTRAEIEEKIRVQIEAKIRQEIEKQSGVKISLGTLATSTI